MTEREFRDYLDSYGAALEKWPQHLRVKAEKALVEDAALRDVLTAEKEFSRAFAVDVPAPDGEFENRILAASYALPQKAVLQDDTLPRLISWRIAASVLLFAAGIALGSLQQAARTDGYAVQADTLMSYYAYSEDGGM
ncbi:MAG: hypothetical protein HND56_01905 [Pseudomonadota bacterium]|nr:hypothetical protein [Pseudomonadota bacterium]QKK04515.1 MAG: hypothetical protein HND56_01905 [Pseudomonadota bacterium]